MRVHTSTLLFFFIFFFFFSGDYFLVSIQKSWSHLWCAQHIQILFNIFLDSKTGVISPHSIKRRNCDPFHKNLKGINALPLKENQNMTSHSKKESGSWNFKITRMRMIGKAFSINNISKFGLERWIVNGCNEKKAVNIQSSVTKTWNHFSTAKWNYCSEIFFFFSNRDFPADEIKLFLLLIFPR